MILERVYERETERDRERERNIFSQLSTFCRLHFLKILPHVSPTVDARSRRIMAPTTAQRVSRFAKYAFMVVALTGTAYYAYMQGFYDAHLDDENDGEKTLNLSKNNEEEEEEDTEKETDEEEEEENVVVDIDEDEERTRIELVKAARRESATKPPRSPLRRNQRETRGTTSEEEEAIKATEEGRSGVGLAEATEVIEERSAGPAKGKNAMEVKKGFLNEKRLSSNGLFGDEERVEEDRDAASSSRKRGPVVKSPLQLIYRNIRKDLLASKTFDASAIAATRSLFHFEPFPGVGVWPVKYDDMKMFPMKSSCSRLIVLSVFDDAPSLAASGTAIVSELSKLMMGFDNRDDDKEDDENKGNATKVRQRPMFVCNRAQYHVTMFFFSRPIEGMMREEPVEFLMDEGVGIASEQNEVVEVARNEEVEPPSTPPPHQSTPMEKQPSIPKGLGEMTFPDKPKPRVKRSISQNYERLLSPPTPMSKIKPPSAISSAENLAHASMATSQRKFKRSASGNILDEATKAQEVLQACESIELVVDRVVLATSGALLLCFDDVNDSLKKSRAALVSNAVGVRGVQQTSTAHCTLARILPNPGDEHLSDYELKQIDQLLTKWTKQLRGTKMICPKAWYVREERFSSVDGDKVRLRFKGH